MKAIVVTDQAAGTAAWQGLFQHQVDAAHVLHGVVLEVDELVRADVERRPVGSPPVRCHRR